METTKTSILVLARVEPSDDILSKIREEYPTGHVDLIRWKQLRKSKFRFVWKHLFIKYEAFYLVCLNIENSDQVPFLLFFSSLFRANKKKLIDLNSVEQICSLDSLLFKAIPHMLLELPLGFLLFFFNLAVLKLLSKPSIMKYLKAKTNTKVRLEKASNYWTIGYFWAFVPDIIVNLKVGGEITHITGFLGGLERLGHKAFLVSTRPIVHECMSAINFVIDEKKIPAWPGEIRDIAYNWKVLWKSRKLIQKCRPGFIYHRSTGYSFVGVLLSIFYRIPLIVEFNSSDVWEAKISGGSRFPKVQALTERISLCYAKKVTVVSNEVRNYFVKQGVPLQKIIANPNGVDPEYFKPNKKSTGSLPLEGLSHNLVVGFIGVFNVYHGLLTLAKAIKPVVDEIGCVHFLIIGDGILRKDFESILKSNNSSCYVTITGKVPHKTVPTLLDSCDILVCPSQNMPDGTTFLGSPTKIFEYMAMEKGIVASRIGQLEQILRHEETALLVKPEDPEELAKGIIRLARDKALRIKLGENARKIVIESYTWVKNAERILKPIVGEGVRIQ